MLGDKIALRLTFLGHGLVFYVGKGGNASGGGV
jgi:hypothetical protein